MEDSNDPCTSANENETSRVGLSDSQFETDDLFEALAHERRRYLLYTLLDADARSLKATARRLAAWENGAPADTVDRDEVEKVYASLYHAHVPKLVDLGVLEYDREDDLVRGGPRAKATIDVLEQAGGSGAVARERHARSDINDR